MARPGLMRHRKFARLARLIGGPVAARGHLELLWDVAYEAGDELLGDAGDVEYLAQWTGEPGALARALVESGFLDETSQGLIVHDLWDHAPEYVRKRRERENERIARGASLSSGPCRAERADRRTADDDRRTAPNGGQRPPNGRTRSPSPSPSPKPPPPTPAVPVGPAAPAVAVVADTQAVHPPGDVADALWERLQLQRVDAGLLAENRPPKRWRAWALATWGSLGCDQLERLAFAHRSYLRDEEFRDRGWPTALFAAGEVWATRVPAPLPGGAA